MVGNKSNYATDMMIPPYMIDKNDVGFPRNK